MIGRAIALLSFATVLPGATYVGNEACRTCHARIYQTYSRTAMARSSGIVRETSPGRAGPYAVDSAGKVTLPDGSKQLQWFVGSGAAGQSYLYGYRGYLYQAPVTWYSGRGAWDASPGFEHSQTPRWNRPIDSNCLFCHASQVRPVYGTQNRFADPPFAQDGIGCERCHGPGSDHVAGKGWLVNPVRLDAERRDAVCAQCHLSGEARIARQDRSIAMYRPGDKLSEYVSYFVREGNLRESAIKATGHYEKLEASRCKQASGDRLWCGTCHDPHDVPSAAQASAFFRERCLSCHQSSQCDRGPDCRSCHMPRGRAVDGGHGVLTDHSIPRRAVPQGPVEVSSWKLVAFRPYEGSNSRRELGLAYAEAGVKNSDRRQMEEAIRLLTPATANDADALLRLADLQSRAGRLEQAVALYRRALEIAPQSPVALVNLGALEAQLGNSARAVALWRRALQSNPGLTEAAVNLEKLLEATRGRTPETDELILRAKKLERGELLSDPAVTTGPDPAAHRLR